MSKFYISEPGGTLRKADLIEWAQWCERNHDIPFGDGGKRVAFDRIEEVSVSTVFLGLQHYGGIFETMIFGGPHDQYQERYQTAEAARLGHAKAVALAKGEAP